VLFLLLLACERAPLVSDSPQDSIVDSAVDTGDSDPEMIQVSGVVFRFVDRALLEGMTVRLDGLDIEVTSGADGAWSAQVPAGSSFTPVIEGEGYLTARHALFTPQDDLDRLYLQAVPTEVFLLMAQTLGEAGVGIDTSACIVVNTVTVPAVYEMSTWEEFETLRPHGEPGVVMELAPTLDTVQPIYFNEFIQPDPSLDASSVDGGVVWLNVPPGTYTVQGVHPDPNYEVIPKTVTCDAGWFVNLNPPLGAGVREKL
jgi:hypothetical protein